MRKLVFATKQILEENHSLANVTYKQFPEDQLLTIACSHAGTTDWADLRLTSWDKLCELCPKLKDVQLGGQVGTVRL